MEANMNLKKLDTIKTPESWKKELLEQSIETESVNFKIKFTSLRKMKWAMVSLAVVLVCATGITVGANNSDSFKGFLQGLFGTNKVQQVNVESNRSNDKGEKTKNKIQLNDKGETPEGKIQLNENMEIAGRNETFILEYNKESSEKVENVYSIKDDQLSRESVNKFKGKYEGEGFSFQYVIKDKEICAFNYSGAISEVFQVIKGRSIYATLCHTQKDTIVKETIVKINLDTNEIEKLSNDRMICNFALSPNGKTLLCNFRSKGYWSMFDLENKTEKKLKKDTINGYATTDEISYVDDYHILTLGKPFTKNKTEYYSKYLVNLKNGKIEKEFFNINIDINLNWTYLFEKNILTIENVIKGDRFQINISEKNVESIISSEKYSIFGGVSNGDLYLINFENKQLMKLNIPEKYRDNIQFYLMGKENKMLITFDKKAYIVDISDLK